MKHCTAAIYAALLKVASNAVNTRQAETFRRDAKSVV